MVFVMFIAILIVNPLITLLVITINGTAAYFIFIKVRKLLYKNAKDIRDNGEKINKHITQALHGIKDVKIFNKENEYIIDNNLLIYKNVKLSALQQIYLKLPNWMMEIIGFSIISFSIFLLYVILKSDSITVAGILTLLAVTAWKVLPAINRILNSITITKTEVPYIEKLYDLFDEIEKNKTYVKNLNKDNILHFTKSIKLKNINFKYFGASEEIFKNLSFNIPSGKVVGIIGTSGAGKSTLIDILIGLLKPSSGKILIDNIELNNDNVNQWIGKIGYVPQAPYLYDGTLAENIAFGYKKEIINRDLVLKCCNMASLGSFINALPDGIDVKIGERGVRISGGQRQRIAIARALYKQPEIMVFDEATSSLDSKNEKLVLNTIYALRNDVTMLIIAHRLTTVKECDLILWLENGKIKMYDTADIVLKKYLINKNVIN